jgi:inhibitor of cysteine peptidase
VSDRVVDPRHQAVIPVRAGEPLEIVLPENPTTGYLWHVDHLAGSLDAQPGVFERSGEAVGAGGHRVFRVVSNEPGDASVTFALRRPKGSDVADRRTVRLTVTP